MMREEADRPEDPRSRPWAILARLVVVLSVVIVTVVLVKRAIAPEQQLQAVLDAEATALNTGDWKGFAALLDPEDPAFHRYQKNQFDSWVSARQRGEPWAMEAPPTLYVVEVGRRGDEAWALVLDDPEGDPAVSPAKIEFFRRTYGQWLHTGPDPDHWGQPQELQRGQITWRYRQADEGQVARLATFAETLAQRVYGDMGLDVEYRELVINLCYSMECGYVISPQDGEMQLPTPLLFGFDDEGLEDLLANLLLGHLVRRAVGPGLQSSAANILILSGIERWEVAQTEGAAEDAGQLLALRQAVAAGRLLTLEALDESLTGENWALASEQAYTLVEYVVAQYGREVLPALARARGQGQFPYPGASTAEALQEALGPDLDLAAFEAGWLAFIRERYGE